MAVYTCDVFVVEHNAMKRPADAPDQLWGGPWFTPEVMVVDVEADNPFEAKLLAAQMGHCTHLFVDPYVVGCTDPTLSPRYPQ
jgi:hypothetical protein